MDSILQHVKKMIGISEEYTNFDIDIITHINTVFSTLTQMGIGPEEGFMIEGPETTWNEYITNVKMNAVQTYMYLKVRLLFDPPTGSVLEAINRTLSELEWRLYIEKENSIITESEVIKNE